MTIRILTLTFAGALMCAASAPVLAQSDDMTCGDYMKMDSSGKMKTVEMMKSDKMSGDHMKKDDMKKDDMKSGHMDMSADSLSMACKGHSKMMLHEAMMKTDMKK